MRFLHLAKHYNEITWIKAIATVFITWFHFKWYVPQECAFLFIGGAIGNSLFFFCSGYLLKFKDEKYYGQWILKKYLRIMPTIWFTFILISICNLFRYEYINTPKWIEWVYPSSFWFISSIFLYFFIIYLIYLINRRFNKNLSNKMIIITALLFCIIHICWYFNFVRKDIINIDEGGIKSWQFFLFFLWGMYSKNKINVGDKKWKSIIHSIFSIFLFFGYKKMAESVDILVWWQFAIIPILLAYIIYSFRNFAIWLYSICNTNWIKSIVLFLSNITLEIYIVQVYIIQWIMPMVIFPLNIIFSLVAIILSAYLIHILASNLSKKLCNIV